MSSAEFDEWIVWAKIRGVFGEERGDLRNGILCALLVNVATAMSGKAGKAKPSEFMPFREKPKRDPEKERDIKQQVEVLQQVFGVKEG